MPTDAHPIDASAPGNTLPSRIFASLDFIRGFAVLGILASNIVVFARPNEARRVAALVHEMDWRETIPWIVNYLFIDGKLRGLFALLFGAGLVLFIERARAAGAPAYWLQLRRLFWLALFGFAHFVFLFEGDILFDYAVLGAFAMWAVFWNPRVLLAIAVLLLGTGSALGAMEMWRDVVDEQHVLALPVGDPDRIGYDTYWSGERTAIAEESRVMANGSMPQIIAHRFPEREDLFEQVSGLQYIALQYLPMMLIGAALFRMGFFSGTWDRRKMLLWGIIGIVASTAIALAMAMWLIAENWRFGLNFFVFYGPTTILRLPMILGYLAILTVLVPRLAPTRFGQRLTAAGRMAFSNYLGMSLLMAFIFQGWGLGLYDRFSRFGQWGFLLLGCALMLAWSKPWLDRFRFGPLEWLWRCLTYWRLFPLKR